MNILNLILRFFGKSLTTAALQAEVAKLQAAVTARNKQRAALKQEADLREDIAKLRAELGIV
jgi:hypothetical protein